MKKYLPILICLLLMIAIVSFAGAAEYDFEGRTVTIRGHNVGESNLFSGAEAQAHLEKIEKEFNVNIEAKQVHQHDTPDLIREGVLAGDADGMYRLMYGQALELALDGFLYNLNNIDVPESYWMKHSFDPDIETIQNNRFFFNTEARRSLEVIFTEINFVGFANGVFYNKDMLEEYGLPDLNDLFEAGDWTWDAFKNTAEQLTQDTTGDGEIDQWGLTGIWGDIGRVLTYLGSNNASTTKTVDGKVKFALDEPEAIEAFEFIRDLIQDGNVMWNWGWPQKPWAEEKTGMMENHFWSYVAVADDLTFEPGFVPFPKGPRAEEHKTDINFPWTWVIPVTSKEDPQALVELHSALFMDGDKYYPLDEFEKLIYQGLGQFAASEEMLENMLFALKSVIVDKYGTEEVLGVNPTDLKKEIANEEKSASSVIDSVAPSVQKNLDMLFQQ